MAKAKETEAAVYQDAGSAHPGVVRAPHVSEVFKLGETASTSETTHGAVRVDLK